MTLRCRPIFVSGFRRSNTRPTLTTLCISKDTQLQGDRMSISAYVSAPMGVPEKTMGTLFTPLEVESHFHATEEMGLQVLKRTLDSPDNTITLTSDLEHVASSVDGLRQKLDAVGGYVDLVLSGAVEGDKKIGRYLLDTVSAIPKLDTEEFEKMFNNSLQDLLMVVYLANLTRTQVLLAEKLNAVL